VPKTTAPWQCPIVPFLQLGVPFAELSMALSRHWYGNRVNQMSLTAAAKYWTSVIVNKNVFKKWFGLKKIFLNIFFLKGYLEFSQQFCF
jgi:hypothetical protein